MATLVTVGAWRGEVYGYSSEKYGNIRCGWLHGGD